MMKGEIITILSTDEIWNMEEYGYEDYPVELLNELLPSSLPLHSLELKINNSVVILLWNLYPP